ncbi:MAG: winged helix-turn-helix transcriptional regulator [Promethearchaeota archaeon]
MDLTDKGILGDLVENCRITYEELARKYGLSANAVKRRIHKLEECGVITGYIIRFSLAMVDAEFLYGVIYTDGSQDEVQFVDMIGASPSVVAAAAYTDGTYVFLAEYKNSVELMELGAFLRRLGGVQSVELHTLVASKGNKMELSQLHRIILKHLTEDPRMTIADLARRTGFSARRVRRHVVELVESNAVLFTVGLELDEAGSIPYLARILWDERKVTHDVVVDWLREQYPRSLWEWYVSVSEPVVFCLFTAEHLNEVEELVRNVRNKEYIERVKITVARYHKSFSGPSYRLLNELIKDV